MTVSVKAPTSTTGSIQLNGSDVLTIDSSGNLTAPNNLTVNSGATFATSQWVKFGTNNTFYADASYGLIVKAPATSNFIAFRDSSDTERMRIDSSGKLNINSSSVYGPSKLGVAYSGTTDWGMTIDDTASSTSSAFIVFATGGALRGLITNVNNTSVAYNTTSDYRLKENVAPMSGSIDRLKQLKPSTWTWIQNGSHGEGFLAHEAQEVVPESVTGTKDAMRTEEYEVTPAVTDDEGNVTIAAVMGTREVPDYQGIDQSKLVPLLTSALQEAITKIENLETRIQALESANV